MPLAMMIVIVEQEVCGVAFCRGLGGWIWMVSSNTRLQEHLPTKAPTTKIIQPNREGTSSIVLSGLNLRVEEEVITGALPNPSSQPECQDNTKATTYAVFRASIFWI
ncbi:hypothetical protein FALCPG4_004739 [Fusarium falciforme]